MCRARPAARRAPIVEHAEAARLRRRGARHAEPCGRRSAFAILLVSTIGGQSAADRVLEAPRRRTCPAKRTRDPAAATRPTTTTCAAVRPRRRCDGAEVEVGADPEVGCGRSEMFGCTGRPQSDPRTDENHGGREHGCGDRRDVPRTIVRENVMILHAPILTSRLSAGWSSACRGSRCGRWVHPNA
jgi:hypothetical protein